MVGKKVLIAIPRLMLGQIDSIAEMEHRTRSDLFREALRRYIQNFEKDHPVAAIDQRLYS